MTTFHRFKCVRRPGLVAVCAAACLLSLLCATAPARGEESSFAKFLRSLTSSNEAKPVKKTAVEKAEKRTKLSGTHESVSTIDIGRETSLNTFCLDPKGNLLAACGGKQRRLTIVNGKRKIEENNNPGEIRVLTPEGKQLHTWKLGFKPEAINAGPDGAIYVAGGGKVAKLDAHGKLLLEKDSPHLDGVDMEQLAADLREQRIERIKRQESTYEKQLAGIKKREEKILETPEDERTPVENRRLQRVQRQYKSTKRMVDRLRESNKAEINDIDIDRMLGYKTRVSGIAVTKQDVYLATPALKGYGYSIWRCDHELKDCKEIVKSLRGCCGQMDIQAQGDEVFAAENSRHRLQRYDRTGKLLKSWGKSDRKGEKGFAGCCNPMNLRIAKNGEVFTSESGIGRVKRFSADGEYLGLVGQVKLIGGCKHVAVEVSDDGRHVYVLDVTNQSIHVMEKKKQSSEDGPAEKAVSSVGGQ